MPRHKSLLVTANLVEAGRRRKCYHDPTHQIQKGEVCLEVRAGLGSKGYCLTCARAMHAEASRRLEELGIALAAGGHAD